MFDLINGKILEHQYLHFSTIEISENCFKEENCNIIQERSIEN